MAQFSYVDAAPVGIAPDGNAYHRRIVVTATAGTLGTFSALATPTVASVTPTGTAGGTAYGYKAVAFLGNGSPTAASAEVTTATGNATLSAINFNRVVWGAVAGAAYYELYRTTGGTTGAMIYQGPLLTYDDVLKTSGTAKTPSTANGTGALPVLLSSLGHNISAKAVSLGVEIGSAGTVYVTFDGQSTPSSTLGFVVPTLPGYIRIPCPDGMVLDRIKLVASANPTYAQAYFEFGG
jgi:hypothetical protein